MRTYVWYSWEMWGNELDGWDFNNRFCSGTTYNLSGEETDDELVTLLGGKPGEIEVDGNSDPEFSIVFQQVKDGKPLGELVPVEHSMMM